MRLYVEVFTGTEAQEETAKTATEVAAALDGSGISVTSSFDDATHALLWVRPAMSLLNDKPDTPLSIALDAETGIDAARVVEIEERLRTVVAVNFTNPWLLDVVAPQAAAVVGTFGVLTDALVDLLRGLVAPRGKLPYTIPADKDAVLAKKSDIPGAEEPAEYACSDAGGARYVFGFGREDVLRQPPRPARLVHSPTTTRKRHMRHTSHFRTDRRYGKSISYRRGG